MKTFKTLLTAILCAGMVACSSSTGMVTGDPEKDADNWVEMVTTYAQEDDVATVKEVMDTYADYYFSEGKNDLPKFMTMLEKNFAHMTLAQMKALQDFILANYSTLAKAYDKYTGFYDQQITINTNWDGYEEYWDEIEKSYDRYADQLDELEKQWEKQLADVEAALENLDLPDLDINITQNINVSGMDIDDIDIDDIEAERESQAKTKTRPAPTTRKESTSQKKEEAPLQRTGTEKKSRIFTHLK